jgi:hypothetical protein
MPDPKDLAALIVKKAVPVRDTEEQTESGENIIEEAAGEVMEAMQAGDAKSFAEALQSFIKIVMP